MAGTASTAERLVALMTDPVSLAGVLVAAILLGTIFAAKARKAAPAPEEDRFGPVGGAPTQPIPLLETPLEASGPTLAAPRRADPPTGKGAVGLVSALAFGAIGLVAFAGLIGLGMKVAGGAAPAAPLPQADAAWTDEVTVLATGPAGCEAGLDGHADSYTHCGASVPVRFEVVGLALDGERLTDAVWAGADARAFVLRSPTRAAPFTLGSQASLLAAPGSALSDYDAYVAVGYADAAAEGEGAGARAEARSLALADLALRSVQGARPRDCRSDVMVHAVSLGAAPGGPPPAPLLIGVHVEDRVNRPRGDAGDLNAMLDGLFASQGAAITGLRPEAYGPWTIVASERACDRSPV